MSSIVVDGSSLIKLIHSKWLIPSGWLGGWIEFLKIGVWVRNQWDCRAPFSFRDHGGTGALQAEECGLCRVQGTGYIPGCSAQAGTAQVSWDSEHRQDQVIQWQNSWSHLYILALEGLISWILHTGSKSAVYALPVVGTQYLAGTKGKFCSTFCVVAFSMWSLLEAQCPSEGSGGWLVPHHSTETGSKWSPPHDSISDTHF